MGMFEACIVIRRLEMRTLCADLRYAVREMSRHRRSPFAVAATLALVALMASLVAAYRALRIDAVQVLRAE
jgi:hypothetical protein